MARGAVPPDPERLENAKRERFCQEYLKDLNAANAARRAGYSARSAKQLGHRLLHTPEVEARILELLEQRSQRTALTQDEVVQGLRTEALHFGDDASHGARVTAWTQLGRHLGMFKDVIDTRDLTLEELMRDAAASDRDQQP